jgi:glycosyltransferase involved in cell wall biosynthesis
LVKPPPIGVVVCRSNPIAPDPRVEKEALALVEGGYAVTIVGWDRTARLPVKEYLGVIPCHRLPIKAEFASGIHNFPALLRWQWGLLHWLISHRHSYSIVHACDFDTLIPAIICKLVWGKKIVYDIFDFYADHLRATPIWIKKVIKVLDLELIGWVDTVIITDESRYAQIEKAKVKRSEVIYNTPQDSFVSEEDWYHKRHHFGLKLAYVGLLQEERGLMTILELLAKHPNWSLDLGGFGGDEEKIIRVAQQLGNVRFYGRISYPLALHLYQEADVLFAIYDPTIENHKYASPNKVYEAMMLGKPVIVARGTNVDRIIETENCGLVVEYGNADDLEAALIELQNDPDLYRKLSRNGRIAYENKYNWTIMRRRLLDLYRMI